MTPELHADDLLDKEARGELSAAERVRLDRHVEACSVCRFERQVRDDFRLEFETLGHAARKEASDAPGRVVIGARTSKRRLSAGVRLTLLAAAAVLVTGAAAAEWETIKRTVFSYVVEQSHAPSDAPVATNESVVKGRPPSASPQSDEKIAIEQEPVLQAPAVDSPRAVETEAEKTPAATKVITEARPSAAKPTLEAPASPSSAPTMESQPSAQPPATAEALFGAANDERQRGAYAEAIRLYRDLAQQFPQSAEATAAHAIVGRLLLDRGDPSGALAQFDAYLQSGMTTLGEEASVARALALERLGRSVEEADAWSALLSSYPQSVHASRARSRLARLGNR